MSNSSFSSLIQPLLCDFAASGEFTTQMMEIFGFSTNSTKIGTLQQQWQQQDFSQLPQIEVVGTEVLNGAKGGYLFKFNLDKTNKIELLSNKLKIFETFIWQVFERSFAKDAQT